MRDKAAGLAFVEFMLATRVETPPEGGDWIHEVKYVKGVTAKPGPEWLEPGTIARVRHLKGEEKLRPRDGARDYLLELHLRGDATRPSTELQERERSEGTTRGKTTPTAKMASLYRSPFRSAQP